MRILTCMEPGVFRYGAAPDPAPENGRVLLRIRKVGVCGTDLHAFEGTQPYFAYPRILGHELSGDIVGREGEGPYTVLPYFACGACLACRQGKPNCCARLQVCGVHVDGGLRDYLSVPAGYLVAGRGLDYEALALVEPLSIGAHAVRRAGIREGASVLVVGAGPIGLGVMAFARLAGARVMALDVQERRLTFCRDHLGIDITFTAGPTFAMEAFMDATGGEGAEVVVDATGNLGAIEAGVGFLAHGGTYVLVGLQKESFRFSHPEFHKRETTLMSSRNATREDFDLVIDALLQGRVSPDGWITHREPFDSAGEAFPGWLDPSSGVVKAMITINP